MSRSLKDIDWKSLKSQTFKPSPLAWEDQVLYFLLVDRFSNDKEMGSSLSGDTPLYQELDSDNAIQTDIDAEAWRNAGNKWVGGTLKGIISKIAYLKGLGVTTLWISPIFKQVAFQDTYHGYGIQNYLEIEPHFGSKEDLRELVKVAHDHGIYVILDIIINHSGNVFSYESGGDLKWNGLNYRVKGFNDALGKASIPFKAGVDVQEDEAIWPIELRTPETFTCKGSISNWDYHPEYLEGDFCDLKDVNLGKGDIDHYSPSKALLNLCEIYKYWIAFADLDGYRLDTVKHMDPGAARLFASEIHEFAQELGKENFYLIGEITGSRQNAFSTLELTGLDAALGIADIQQNLENVIKGYADPSDYFGLFRNSILVGKESHVWFRDKVVTMVDDHDKVCQGSYKARFCAKGNGNSLMLNALALNAMTIGIPCIYYGSEQLFDGQGGEDRYIREAMFGGNFGAFRSKGRHFFNTESYVYKELSKILTIRQDRIALRRGRQYLREISGNGKDFGLPRLINGATEIKSIIPWSRIFNGEELVLAISTDVDFPLTAWVTIDSDLHTKGDIFYCIYSVDPAQISKTVAVEERNGKALLITVPKAGFVIYAKK